MDKLKNDPVSGSLGCVEFQALSGIMQDSSSNYLITQFFFLAFLIVCHVGDIKEGLEDQNLLYILE